jgi:hypothetical protein
MDRRPRRWDNPKACKGLADGPVQDPAHVPVLSGHGVPPAEGAGDQGSSSQPAEGKDAPGSGPRSAEGQGNQGSSPFPTSHWPANPLSASSQRANTLPPSPEWASPQRGSRRRRSFCRVRPFAYRAQPRLHRHVGYTSVNVFLAAVEPALEGHAPSWPRGRSELDATKRVPPGEASWKPRLPSNPGHPVAPLFVRAAGGPSPGG